MKKFLLSLLTIAFAFSAQAVEKQVTSPDGKLVVTLSDENGVPTYAVAYEQVSFIETSPIGLVTNIGDFSKQMSMGAEVQIKEVVSTTTEVTFEHTITGKVCVFFLRKTMTPWLNALTV